MSSNDSGLGAGITVVGVMGATYWLAYFIAVVILGTVVGFVLLGGLVLFGICAYLLSIYRSLEKNDGGGALILVGVPLVAPMAALLAYLIGLGDALYALLHKFSAYEESNSGSGKALLIALFAVILIITSELAFVPGFIFAFKAVNSKYDRMQYVLISMNCFVLFGLVVTLFIRGSEIQQSTSIP